MLHEKNWRVSLCVQELFHPPRFSLNSCSHSWISAHNGARPESAHNGFSRSLGVSSWFVFRFFGWLGSARDWFHGKQRVSQYHLFNIWTWRRNWRGINSTLILSFSNLPVARCCCSWWRRRAWCGCRMMTLLSWRCHGGWRMRTGWRTRWQAWNHDRNEVLRVTLYPNPVFEWDVVFDRWSTHKNIRFHRKAFRVIDCWRILEDFHCREYIQFFDVHCGPFMRLYFSIGYCDCRRTARFRQSIHFSITQVLFADHVHWRSTVYNKFFPQV